jgi:hypothetical protein
MPILMRWMRAHQRKRENDLAVAEARAASDLDPIRMLVPTS